jgi:hypothetical protein
MPDEPSLRMPERKSRLMASQRPPAWSSVKEHSCLGSRAIRGHVTTRVLRRKERSQVLCGAPQAACELQVPTRTGRSRGGDPSPGPARASSARTAATDPAADDGRHSGQRFKVHSTFI